MRLSALFYGSMYNIRTTVSFSDIRGQVLKISSVGVKEKENRYCDVFDWWFTVIVVSDTTKFVVDYIYHTAAYACGFVSYELMASFGDV